MYNFLRLRIFSAYTQLPGFLDFHIGYFCVAVGFYFENFLSGEKALRAILKQHFIMTNAKERHKFQTMQ